MAEMQRHPPHAVVVPLRAQGHVNPLMNFANLLAARGYFITFITTASFADRNFCPSKGYVEVSTAMQHPQPGLSGFRYVYSKWPSLEPSTHEVAKTLGVPRVVFWTFCATAAIATANSRILLSKGYIPVNVKEVKHPEKLITCLPGNIPPLWPTDLLTSFRTQDTADASFQIALYEAEMQSKADYVLVNSFEESLTVNGAAAPIVARAWKEDSECLKWLDTQPPGSVLYVSFGSIVVVSAAARIGFRVEGKSTALLVGTQAGCSRRKVLSHPSVGGFMTHCGWNSTLESISFGVPIIGWPLRADQFLNCRFAKEMWRIGMDFDSRFEDENVLVTRDQVEKGREGFNARTRGKKLEEQCSETQGGCGEGSDAGLSFLQKFEQVCGRHDESQLRLILFKDNLQNAEEYLLLRVLIMKYKGLRSTSPPLVFYLHDIPFNGNNIQSNTSVLIPVDPYNNLPVAFDSVKSNYQKINGYQYGNMDYWFSSSQKIIDMVA
eukprot:Gb_30222 [translate_table: standard]